MNIKPILSFLLLLIISMVPEIHAAETAPELMNRVATAMKGAKSLSASFSMSSSAGSMTGTYTSAGKKFAVVTNGPSTWYNGTNMWTYNPHTGETTLVKPTTSEVAESNPFAIISSMANSFTAYYAKSQPAGTKVLVLLPKKSGSSIKKVVLTLDATRATPTKIVITDQSGNTTVNVTKFAANVKVAGSTFDYPQKRYPKAKIIDLR